MTQVYQVNQHGTSVGSGSEFEVFPGLYQIRPAHESDTLQTVTPVLAVWSYGR